MMLPQKRCKGTARGFLVQEQCTRIGTDRPLDAITTNAVYTNRLVGIAVKPL